MFRQKSIFIGALCVLSLLGFPAANTAEASGAGQEAHARQLAIDSLPNMIMSGDDELVELAHHLQRRVCEANGMEVTDSPFVSEYDYKTKVHPVRILASFGNAESFGGGLIYAGEDYIKNTCFDGADAPITMYHYIQLEELWGHELTHGQKRHNIRHLYDLGKDRELEAEEGSVAKLENLPEGGWGGYVLSITKHPNRPKQNKKVLAKLEKRTNGAIGLSTALTEESHSTYYHAANGAAYSLHFTFGATDESHDGLDENTYLAGQLAECIAKNALTLDSIQVTGRSALGDAAIEDTIAGLVVCSSDKLPTTRVLMGFSLVEDRTTEQVTADLQRVLPEVKRLVVTGQIPLSDYNQSGANWRQSRAYTKLLQHFGDKRPLVWRQDFFRLWLTCAITQDNAQR